jgi:hypothetical protein
MNQASAANRRTTHRHLLEWSVLIGLLAVASLTLLRQLTNNALGYPDADRILMDGVFFRDFLVDLPLLKPYDYIINYFGQYPALSIGYRPPFFPFVEGLFNLVTGVEIWSSRLALFSFAVAGGTAFYLLIRRTFDWTTAAVATLFLATTPFLAQFGWYTMAEVPVVSMALITALFFQRYMSEGKTRDLVLTAIALVLALYTKQTAMVLAIWMVLYTLGSLRVLEQLRQRRVWVTIVVACIAILPLIAVTLWLSDQHMVQSVGVGNSASIAAKLQTNRLLQLPEQLYTLHLTAPVLILALIGFLWGTVRRDRRLWLWLSLILAVYLLFTYIANQNSRYPIFWIPAFCALAAMPVAFTKPGTRLRTAVVLLAVGIGAYQVWQVYARAPKFATGYDEAAAYVLEHSESPTVFFDGYNNGYFTYFMRAHDPERSMWVLRGDKLLTSTSIAGDNMLEVHIDDAAGIDAMMDKLGPQYIVVESRNTIDLPAHAVLREHLEASSDYALRQTIPVDTGTPSTRAPLDDLDLLIYERLNRSAPTGGILELRLPVVGQTLQIPLRDLDSR